MPAPPLLWLLLGLSLLALSLAGLDSDGLLLIAGVASLLLALLATLLPLPADVQLLLALALFAAGYAALRRWSGRSRERAIPPAANADSAAVIQAFDAQGLGRVLWQGQSWAAQNLAPERALPVGSRVAVLGREGTRLQVLPGEESAEGPAAAPLSRRTSG
jgi:membrane protein implicated in regulation of membrane protease activity